FGLIFLFFFMGLDFSIHSLRKTKKPATIIAFTDIGLNFLIGFIVGALFGWPLKDTIFLAGIIGMSSLVIAQASIRELRMSTKPETEFILSTMVVEDLLSITILTLAVAFAVEGVLETRDVVKVLLGVFLIFSFFFSLTLLVMPRLSNFFEKIKKHEALLLFVVVCIFLSAVFAEFFMLPAVIGTFFAGMTFADTPLSKELKEKTYPIRNVFAVLFFVSFGMMTNLSFIQNVIPMVIFAVILAVTNEVIIIGAIAYLIGFSSRAAVSLGSTLVGRGEDALAYAGVGATLKNPNTNELILKHGSEFYPFASVFCLIMSTMLFIIMKRSVAIADFFKDTIPQSVKFSGYIVHKTLKYFIMQTTYGTGKKLFICISLYILTFFCIVITTDYLHIFFIILSILSIAIICIAVIPRLELVINEFPYYEIYPHPSNPDDVLKFIILISISLLSIPVLIASFWVYSWYISIFSIFLVLLIIIIGMSWLYNTARGKKEKIFNHRKN
ncbi:MAG: cation:proton antiporter, partial [Candidatus Thermoplasmatota archaeon]